MTGPETAGERGRSLWREDEKRDPAAKATDPTNSLDIWNDADSSEEASGADDRRQLPIWAPPPPPRTTPEPETGPESRPESRPRSEPKPSKPSKKPRHARKKSVARRVIGYILLIALLAAVGDVVLAVVWARGSLQQTADGLIRGRDALGDGDLELAESEFASARADASDAASALDRPTLSFLASVPLLNRDVDALRRISAAAGNTAEAATGAVDVAEALGVTDTGLGASIYQNGQLDLDAVERALEPLAAVTVRMTAAESLLAGSPQPVLPPVRDALLDARGQVTDASEAASDGEALFEALPALLGSDGTRKYLLAFQASGEARATGGVIGLYGTLIAEGGRLRLGTIAPYQDLFPGGRALPENVEAPPWFAENYESQYALRQWQQVNSSPNFPVVAQVLLNMFEEVTDQRLDGVLAMDPVALRDLMGATGPLEVGTATVTKEEILPLIFEDSYTDFPTQRAQNRVLGQIVTAFWSKIRDGDFNPAAFSEGLGRAVRSRHVSIYSADADAQQAIAQIEADGSYGSPEANTQMVFHNNYAVNKVDYYLRRSIDTRVRLTTNGTAQVTTRVEMRNRAPDGPPSLLLGPGIEGDPVGLNRMLFNVLAPPTARFDSTIVNGKEAPFLYYRDNGSQVGWDLIEIPAGGNATVEVQYTIAGAIDIVRNDARFRFNLVPQALPNVDTYSVRIEAPSGFEIRTGDFDASPSRSIVDTGQLDETVGFDLLLQPTD